MSAHPISNPACDSSGCTRLKDPGRLAALHATGLFGTPPEASFDRFTRLASNLLKAPITAITLIDDERLFLKSHVGIEGPLARDRVKPVDSAFCKYIVDTVEPLIINDTRLDERICDFDLVTEGALAYLAAPLISADGHTLGTFCAMQGAPRAWSDADISIMTDLASSVMTEIELRMVSGRLLEQYNQLRATELQRDDMLQMLVHDLRNPLSSLLAGLNLIDDMHPLKGDQKQALGIAQRGGDALLDMVNQILDVSRMEAGHAQIKRTPTQLSSLLATAVEQVSQLATQAGVKLHCDAADGLPEVPLDRDKIRRVLVNLLSNAIQHTPAGGQVSLTAALGPDDSLILNVRDNGLGIPADRISRIFDKFSGLHLKRLMGTSTGLGLAFCKQVAKAHGGDVTVESTLSEGSLFSLTLPIRA